MSSMLKAMIALALVLPMTAYVAGSLMASGAGEPADRGPVIISDSPSPTSPPTAKPRPTPTRPSATNPSTPTPSVPQDDAEEPIGENEARVVTPKPTPVGDDDDDDGPEGDDDDTTTGDGDDDGDDD